MEYEIISGYDSADVTRRVTEKLNKGYWTVGNLVVTVSPHSCNQNFKGCNILYSQALKRKVRRRVLYQVDAKPAAKKPRKTLQELVEDRQAARQTTETFVEKVIRFFA